MVAQYALNIKDVKQIKKIEKKEETPFKEMIQFPIAFLVISLPLSYSTIVATLQPVWGCS